MKITESQLKKIIKSKVKKALKENNTPYGSIVPPIAGQPSSPSNPTFRGVEGTEFIWHGNKVQRKTVQLSRYRRYSLVNVHRRRRK